ncbi:fimbrial protein [Edaphovirga cremea]|uniref:fimbrial protein n=1 Tax=Edaphovirga cremea TaxID=2267246 RepID=UPI000DEEFF28|nr:fimbrial protein [Edaphovirga cremea]
MKKSLLSTTLALALSMGYIAIANASGSGTITFNGELTDTTCDVTVNGEAADATVKLPTVGVSQLNADGAITGRERFNMELTNCAVVTEGGKNQVSVFFQQGATVDSKGHLINTLTDATAATLVDLQLLDASNNYLPINAGDASQTTTTAYAPIPDGGSLTLPYAVQYYANGQATPGLFSSSVMYNLQYQ